MTARVDILDQPESLRRPLTASLTVHLAVVGLTVAGSWFASRNAMKWGDPNAMGGAVGITPVSQIPLPQRAAPQNLVANPSKSSVPSQPTTEKPKPKTFTKQELDAIALSEKKKAMRELEKLARNQRYRPQNSERPNQLYSSTGAAISSPLYGGVPGAGGIGIGGVLGDRFGAYASLLQQRIASHWNTSGIDARIQNARIVTVRFEIMRDGSARNITVFESSGMGALDNSAVRAVTDASPFPPLPAAYSGNSAEIEVYFKLRR
jgi:protein TonB